VPFPESERPHRGKSPRVCLGERAAPLPQRPERMTFVTDAIREKLTRERKRGAPRSEGQQPARRATPGGDGRVLWDSYVRTLCKRLAAKAGIEKRCHPHGLRHGWALAQVQAGTSLNAIQQLLGHRSLHTTSVYLQHIAPAAAVAEATAKTAHLAVAP
jgi:site-specific recombinase XerD